MKKKGLFICIILLSCLSGSAMAQLRYKQGYFISHDGKKTECLIYDIDWLNNPKEFRYKLESQGTDQRLGLDDVKEFGVDGSRFINEEVNIDTARQETKNLNYNRNPEWKTMRVFLRVLVDGKASLYSYRTPFIEKFLYSVDGSPVEQLVYKEFLVKPEHRMFISTPQVMRENQLYLQQLKDRVLCGNLPDEELKRIAYKEDHLQRHFENFNSCHGAQQVQRVRPTKINMYAAPGIDLATFKLSDGTNYTDGFENSMTARLGFMVEYVLAFNNGKWSMIAEPTYQSYSSGDRVKYRSLELPLGVRHNFFLTENSKLFIDGCFILDFPLKYRVEFSQSVTWNDNSPSASFAAGAGINVKRYSFEVRKYFTRSILGGHSYRGYFFVYDKVSFIVGFRLK